MVNMHIKNIAVCLICFLHIKNTIGVVLRPTDHSLEVNLTHIGFNYAIPFNIASVENLPMIADTGNNEFMVYDRGYQYDAATNKISSPDVGFPINPPKPNLFLPIPGQKMSCLFLYEDGFDVQFYNKFSVPSSNNCEGAWGNVQIIGNQIDSTIPPIREQAILVNTSFSITSKFVGGALHNWTKSNGNIGLGYDAGLTKFQKLLNETTRGTNMTFGLDFNDPDSNMKSTMQFGQVKAEYRNKLQWARQGLMNPAYHFIQIKNLGICNADVNMFGKSNGLNSFQVLVDTGQVCLRLPAEIYTSVVSWLADSYDKVENLPSISFQVDGGLGEWESSKPSKYDLMYIPLENLLVDENVMEGVAKADGAPSLTVGNKVMKLCLLNSKPMFTADDQKYMNNPAPSIVFGSLALRSLYFAAEFNDKSVALASTLTAGEVDNLYAHSQCKAPLVCVGQEVFNSMTNACKEPVCDYFFSYLDQDTKTCVNRLDLYNAGIVIIFICVFFEVTSFFIMQYSAIQLMGIESSNFRFTRPMNTKIDPFTYYMGKYLSLLVDTLSIYLSEYFPDDNETFEYEQ
jgi:hypothetical protein